MGAIFGGAFVLYGPEIRGIGGGIILAVMCFLGGAFWALLCAIPKAYWNVNESLTTLMLNYIALIILSYLVLGPWKMPGQNVGGRGGSGELRSLRSMESVRDHFSNGGSGCNLPCI